MAAAPFINDASAKESQENVQHITDESEMLVFAVFCQLASLLDNKTIEETAVNIFGFLRQDFLMQERLLCRSIMFLVLSSWLHAQQGSDVSKMFELLRRLKQIERKDLVTKKQLEQIMIQLGFQRVKSNFDFPDDFPESHQEAQLIKEAFFENYHLVEFGNPTEQFHEIAGLFHTFKTMQDAAVKVFGFSAGHIHDEIRMALEQFMFNVLCLWWRRQ